jgi:hypothetical protein
VQDPSTVRISCDVAALDAGVTDGNGRLQVIPQSEGYVTVTVTLISTVGDLDIDRSNNAARLQVLVGPGG